LVECVVLIVVGENLGSCGTASDTFCTPEEAGEIRYFFHDKIAALPATQLQLEEFLQLLETGQEKWRTSYWQHWPHRVIMYCIETKAISCHPHSDLFLGSH
jgi:hypothetical protein